MRRMPSLCCSLLAVLLVAAIPAVAESMPLRVFILVGQSNMEGHAKIETFDYIGDDPATAPLLKQMRGPDGKPRVCEGAWISYLTGSGDNNGEGHHAESPGTPMRADTAARKVPRIPSPAPHIAICIASTSARSRPHLPSQARRRFCPSSTGRFYCWHSLFTLCRLAAGLKQQQVVKARQTW